MPDLKTRRPLIADLLALSAGALLPLAFAPFDLWPLAILPPIVLLWCWDNATSRCAALRGGPRVVSIGPVTSDTARAEGLEVHAEAAEHTIPGLVAALLADVAAAAPAP